MPPVTRATINIIAALGLHTHAIGKDNGLLWRIPGDLPRFKALTMGHPIVMGARTFESIGKPLPDRHNIVLTNDPTWRHEGVIVCHTLDEALEQAAAFDTEIFIVGGGSVYAQTIDLADTLHLTLVDDDTPGDTFFPDFTTHSFCETFREEHLGETPPFAWATLKRVEQPPHKKMV